MPQWEVIGGSDKGGILVREGQDLKSPQCSERLSTGAVIEEIEKVGERIHYKRLTGTGPAEGWVSLKISGKDLLAPKASGSAPVATNLKAASPLISPVGKAPGQARVRLVLFSWTGNRGGAGSAHNFTKWPKQLTAESAPDTWEVCQVNYAGRGMRIKDANAKSAAEIAGPVVEALKKAGEIPTVLFGFSFGAILAYETAAIMAANGKPPLALVVASAEHPKWAGRARGVGPDGGPTKDLSETAFEKVLKDKGGTDVILSNPDMKKMYVPVILADMIMEESYGANLPSHPALNCPVLAFRGSKCPTVSREDTDGWSAVTTGSSKVVELDTGLSPADGAPWLSDWYLCQGEKSVDKMITEICKEYSDPAAVGGTAATSGGSGGGFYDLSAKDGDGSTVNFDSLRDKAVLIGNVASK